MSQSVQKHAVTSSYPLAHLQIYLTYLRSCTDSMADDVAFRSCLVWLAAVVVFVGLYTQSFKKMLATYLFGIFAIGGVLLPDWDFFDRRVSQWCTPVSVDHDMDAGSHSAHFPTMPARFRIYPVRMVIYVVVYGFGLYKWWMYISN
ncbi:hypothetical protein RJ639_033541 [Escallonia herrerae]|uniref:Signal peptidase complex-like protein DTM1 n=1 Tax=Escallonia herrerae TaxID=1293975 RepID=A0AA88WTN1_9ASTE|nr:hypothetical protein RJ639_033541 [Escallonia herrerae]